VARKVADSRRQALLEAAIASLKHKGHDGLSARNIATQARVSLGLINHYFPTKEILVAEAYGFFHQQLFDVHKHAIARAKPSAKAQLKAFFTSTFSRPNLDREVLSAWLVFWSMLYHSKEIQRVHAETYARYVNLIRDMLNNLIREQGKLSISARLAAIGLTAMLDGLWLEWCLDPEHFSPAEAIRLCETWLEGLSVVRSFNNA
jgi:TetR/AcrR family transcriptional regulator, transcriptional repressor of bet genes